MVEYVIEFVSNGQVIALLHTERDGSFTRVKPTVDGYAHVTKYRVKARAEAVSKKHFGTFLAATYGGFVYGSKSTVPPVQSKVNRRSAYRSI